jgi:pimeloyl-ACP methyl ester carboxylesterase
MNEPALRHVQCLDSRGLHRMAYWDWGEAGAERVLVCVHGLSPAGPRLRHAGWRPACRLPRRLSRRRRPRRVRLAGRSRAATRSQAYVADMVTLLARLDAKTVHWVGTSMGG